MIPDYRYEITDQDIPQFAQDPGGNELRKVSVLANDR